MLFFVYFVPLAVKFRDIYYAAFNSGANCGLMARAICGRATGVSADNFRPMPARCRAIAVPCKTDWSVL
jgi:hypothetical protein